MSVAHVLRRTVFAMDSSQSPFIPIGKLRAWFRKGFIVPFAVKIACIEDPWNLFLKMPPSSRAFFLDSAGLQTQTAAHSYFGSDPFLVFRRKCGRSFLEKKGTQRELSGGLLSTLRKIGASYKGRSWDTLPPFTGGAVGYFGYETAWEFERLPKMSRHDIGADDVCLLFVKNLFAVNHAEGALYLISNLIPAETPSFDRALEEARAWTEEARVWLSAPGRLPEPRVSVRNFKADIGKKKFKQMVGRAKEYIAAGDIYQANLSQRFSFAFSGDAEFLYQHLRKINPSPFSSFLKLGHLTVVSCSPERLVKKEGRRCEARPIAGTRPRGRTKPENEKFRKELASNAKERAEHIMLVDLARNDLGRVCRPHSVRVSDLMALEEYSHVIHLASNVAGEMEKGKDGFDLIKAMFPGGTITGCPKIRCMEIIESLEPFSRSLYTGSVGWLGFEGNLDLNIVIRTILLFGKKGYVHVGAGIVYDSKPESEYWETMHKGEALLEALIRSSRPA